MNRSPKHLTALRDAGMSNASAHLPEIADDTAGVDLFARRVIPDLTAR